MKELSFYIHFPYCELKCPYCDFNSHVVDDFHEENLLECYKKEIDFFLEKIAEKRLVRSIFFGGGTPSLMLPNTTREVINYILNHKNISVSKNIEITLEANPSSSEYKKFVEFKNAGINRLSIGVQSFNENNLKFLGRKHNAKEAKEALLMARDVFDNFSFDIIYLLPNQTLKDLEEELFSAMKYAKNHISAYTLTIEKGTPFYKMFSEKKFSLPQQEDEFYNLANTILANNGFERYEVSNYCKSGFASIHNLSYWQSIDYIGVGPGAHGRLTINKQRFASYNFAHPIKYMQSFKNATNALQNLEQLTQEDVLKEILIMNLRTIYGIDLKAIKESFNINLLEFINEKNLNSLLENNLVFFDHNVLKITSEGLNILNAIVLKLLK